MKCMHYGFSRGQAAGSSMYGRSQNSVFMLRRVSSCCGVCAHRFFVQAMRCVCQCVMRSDATNHSKPLRASNLLPKPMQPQTRTLILHPDFSTPAPYTEHPELFSTPNHPKRDASNEDILNPQLARTTRNLSHAKPCNQEKEHLESPGILNLSPKQTPKGRNPTHTLPKQERTRKLM